jgi:hypothetical protein
MHLSATSCQIGLSTMSRCLNEELSWLWQMSSRVILWYYLGNPSFLEILKQTQVWACCFGSDTPLTACHMSLFTGFLRVPVSRCRFFLRHAHLATERNSSSTDYKDEGARWNNGIVPYHPSSVSETSATSIIILSGFSLWLRCQNKNANPSFFLTMISFRLDLDMLLEIWNWERFNFFTRQEVGKVCSKKKILCLLFSSECC